MKADLSRAPVQERYRHLLTVIGGERFLKMQGLGNEVPFFVCPYKPEEAVDMDRLRKQLINKLAQNGIAVLDINLYDLAIQILKKELSISRDPGSTSLKIHITVIYIGLS